MAALLLRVGGEGGPPKAQQSPLEAGCELPGSDGPCTPKRDSSSIGAAASPFSFTAGSMTDSSDDYAAEQSEAAPLLQQRFAAAGSLTRPATQHAPAGQLLLVALACAAWIGVSTATILINKHILVDLSFHFPAAVAALGMLGTTVASFLACAVFRIVPCKVSVSPYFFFTRILTTGFFMALSFQAGNTAYLYLSVAFVQMLKAFTPVSTMLCGFLFRLEQPSARLIAAVSCICCGVVVSSYGELNFSWFGVLSMLTSVGAEGLRMVMMQHLLAAKSFHPLEAWMYLAPACSIWLLLLIGVFEAHHIQDQHGFDIIGAHGVFFAFAALAGFAVNALAMLVISLASALTLKVLGICKDIGLVVSGVVLLGEHVSGLQVAGYSVSLLGFGAYNYVKAMMAAQPPQQQAQQAALGSKQQAAATTLDAKQQQQAAAIAVKVGAKAQRSISSSGGRLQGLIGSVPALQRGGMGDPLLPVAHKALKAAS